MAQGKKIKKNRLTDILIIIVLLAILGLVTRATWSLFQKNQLALNNLRSSDKRLEDLSLRESSLRSKIERLKTPRGIEEEIRTNFPVIKMGEKVINIVEYQESAPTSSPPKSFVWWKFWEI